ncbi:2459_t:CDS:2, partial [Racocetra fulgida]
LLLVDNAALYCHNQPNTNKLHKSDRLDFDSEEISGNDISTSNSHGNHGRSYGNGYGSNKSHYDNGY